MRDYECEKKNVNFLKKCHVRVMDSYIIFLIVSQLIKKKPSFKFSRKAKEKKKTIRLKNKGTFLFITQT